MKLAHFYESIANFDAASASGPSSIKLANRLVLDLQCEFDRLRDYERNYAPSFEDENDDARAVEVLRSFSEMYESWLREAESVYQSITKSPSAATSVSGLEELRRSLIVARLFSTSVAEEELEAVKQLRRGEGKRMTVQELRNELRARGRA